MSEAMMGVRVRWCGHRGYAVAVDIHRIGDVNVLVADPRNVSDAGLRRDAVGLDECEAWVEFFPVSGYQSKERGVFVVPHEQVKDLRGGGF